MQRTGQNEGFTLVELIVVLAIISLLAGVAVPTIMGFRSRRGRSLDDAALILRATLRAARTHAIQNRVRAGVFFDDSGRWYQVRYYEEEYTEEEYPPPWTPLLGTFGKERVLPENVIFSLDSTVVSVTVDYEGTVLRAHIFDPTGTLDNPSALKATITIGDNHQEVPPVQIEILRATGRVRIR